MYLSNSWPLTNFPGRASNIYTPRIQIFIHEASCTNNNTITNIYRHYYTFGPYINVITDNYLFHLMQWRNPLPIHQPFLASRHENTLQIKKQYPAQ